MDERDARIPRIFEFSVGTGNSLLPRLPEAQARLAGRDNRVLLEAGLREAEKMHRAMGAPDPADRLAKELKV
jgi:hypothetical protein